MKKPPVAVLTLVVEYDDLPDRSELEELLDKAREVGGPVQAKFEIRQLVTTDLLSR